MALFTQVLVVAVCVIIAECSLPFMNNMMGGGGMHMMGPGGMGVGIGAGIGHGMMGGGMMGGGMMGPGMMGPGMMGPGMMGGGMMGGGMMGPGMMGYKDQDKVPEKPSEDERVQPSARLLAEDLATAIDELDNLQRKSDSSSLPDDN